ncbi:hypothetical protein PR048_026745 [Dryococelus australis]|uniref:Uncharacterized protein n=1 Tax=Dryococelus australis TaxID=614101 RepID=A0ABQ9GM80_9NEOP|nr:hypothetical protein PR048_026745 [Dryococelus australis]
MAECKPTFEHQSKLVFGGCTSATMVTNVYRCIRSLAQFQQGWDIKQLHTSPYCPCINLVEHLNTFIKGALTIYHHNKQRRWGEVIALLNALLETHRNMSGKNNKKNFPCNIKVGALVVYRRVTQRRKVYFISSKLASVYDGLYNFQASLTPVTVNLVDPTNYNVVRKALSVEVDICDGRRRAVVRLLEGRKIVWLALVAMVSMVVVTAASTLVMTAASFVAGLRRLQHLRLSSRLQAPAHASRQRQHQHKHHLDKTSPSSAQLLLHSIRGHYWDLAVCAVNMLAYHHGCLVSKRYEFLWHGMGAGFTRRTIPAFTAKNRHQTGLTRNRNRFLPNVNRSSETTANTECQSKWLTHQQTTHVDDLAVPYLSCRNVSAK